MFGLSGEHLLILAAVLLIFGPRKLPELGGSIGKALRNFKEGLNSPNSSGQITSRPANQGVAPSSSTDTLIESKLEDKKTEGQVSMPVQESSAKVEAPRPSNLA